MTSRSAIPTGKLRLAPTPVTESELTQHKLKVGVVAGFVIVRRDGQSRAERGQPVSADDCGSPEGVGRSIQEFGDQIGGRPSKDAQL